MLCGGRHRFTVYEVGMFQYFDLAPDTEVWVTDAQNSIEPENRPIENRSSYFFWFVAALLVFALGVLVGIPIGAILNA